MATLPLLADADLAPGARAVFEEIRAARGTDYVNNFWRALAHDPVLLRQTWERVRDVMAPGALDPLTKDLVYVAVSTVNGCAYCVHSHTASAKAKGLTPAMHAELLAVIACAMTTNGLATALGAPVDARFDAEAAAGE